MRFNSILFHYGYLGVLAVVSALMHVVVAQRIYDVLVCSVAHAVCTLVFHTPLTEQIYVVTIHQIVAVHSCN